MNIENTVKDWQAQLEDVRRRRVERGGEQVGLTKLQQVLGMTGSQVMKALLDFALGCAVQTKLPVNVGYTTSQINVNIIKSANVKTGPLRCIETAIHVGSQIGTSKAKIVGPDGKLYAHATTTCTVFPESTTYAK